jgi:hypothetical protein
MNKHPVTSLHLGFGLAVALAGAAFLALALSSHGGSGSAGRQQLAQARHETAFHVHREERLRRLQRELGKVQDRRPAVHVEVTGAAPAASPVQTGPEYVSVPSAGSCGGDLSVDASTTTCPFAHNVEQAYYAEVGAGEGTVEAYSPATHRSYLMSCSGSPHECTGGDEAVVYFP